MMSIRRTNNTSAEKVFDSTRSLHASIAPDIRIFGFNLTSMCVGSLLWPELVAYLASPVLIVISIIGIISLISVLGILSSSSYSAYP